MAIAGYSGTISSSATAIGPAKAGSIAGINYSPNNPGNTDFPIGCLCPESKAAGGAVTCVTSDKKCQGVQGTRFVIGDLGGSLHALADHVNFQFHCNGQQSRMATNLNLNVSAVG